MSLYRQIRYCRLCRRSELVPVFSLGNQYLARFPKDPAVLPPQAPLEVVFCTFCLLPQLAHTVDPEELYKEYWYRSSTSETQRDALKAVAYEAFQLARIVSGDLVVDIGSSDGFLLSQYAPYLRRVGFEPNNIGAESPGDIEVVADYFGPWHGLPKAKVITSVAMFYDVPDPLEFISDVADLLADDGVWINQMNYLPLILQNNAYDFCSAEHLHCWSLTTLKAAVERCGLEVCDVWFDRVLNGGTFRTAIRHKGCRPVSSMVDAALSREVDDRANTVEAWRSFGKRVEAETMRLMGMMEALKTEGKMVVIRGASTRGSVIIQHACLSTWIEYAADRDKNKHGRYIGGTGIRIVSEEEAKAMHPDGMVLSIYSYIDQLRKRDAQYLAEGGRYIVPLPEVKVLS